MPYLYASSYLHFSIFNATVVKCAKTNAIFFFAQNVCEIWTEETGL